MTFLFVKCLIQNVDKTAKLFLFTGRHVFYNEKFGFSMNVNEQKGLRVFTKRNTTVQNLEMNTYIVCSLFSSNRILTPWCTPYSHTDKFTIKYLNLSNLYYTIKKNTIWSSNNDVMLSLTSMCCIEIYIACGNLATKNHSNETWKLNFDNSWLTWEFKSNKFTCSVKYMHRLLKSHKSI